MSSGKNYIPSSNIEFNGFQINLVEMVVDNATAWDLAAGKVTTMQAAQTTYQPFYDAIANPATATKAGRANHEVARDEYETYLRKFVKENLVNNSAISAGEKIELGLNPGLNPPNPRPHITTAPFILMKALGSLTVQFEFRVAGDSNRPSIHPDSDGLELRLAISNTPPVSYLEAQGISFSKKARGTRILDDPTYRGQHLYMFARWANLSDDAKSGPWSEMASVLIS